MHASFCLNYCVSAHKIKTPTNSYKALAYTVKKIFIQTALIWCVILGLCRFHGFVLVGFLKAV